MKNTEEKTPTERERTERELARADRKRMLRMKALQKDGQSPQGYNFEDFVSGQHDFDDLVSGIGPETMELEESWRKNFLRKF